MIYASRMAAFHAMVVLDHIQNMGLSQVQMQRDGSVKFRHNGVPFHAEFVAGRFIATIITKQVQAPARVEAQIDPSPASVMIADALAKYNPQHHASDPHGRVRKNAFGDVCQKPMIEGYDDEAYATVLANRAARAQALARVRDQEQARKGGSDAARRLCNVRRAYITG